MRENESEWDFGAFPGTCDENWQLSILLTGKLHIGGRFVPAPSPGIYALLEAWESPFTSSSHFPSSKASRQETLECFYLLCRGKEEAEHLLKIRQDHFMTMGGDNPSPRPGNREKEAFRKRMEKGVTPREKAAWKNIRQKLTAFFSLENGFSLLPEGKEDPICTGSPALELCSLLESAREAFPGKAPMELLWETPLLLISYGIAACARKKGVQLLPRPIISRLLWKHFNEHVKPRENKATPPGIPLRNPGDPGALQTTFSERKNAKNHLKSSPGKKVISQKDQMPPQFSHPLKSPEKPVILQEGQAMATPSIKRSIDLFHPPVAALSAGEREEKFTADLTGKSGEAFSEGFPEAPAVSSDKKMGNMGKTSPETGPKNRVETLLPTSSPLHLPHLHGKEGERRETTSAGSMGSMGSMDSVITPLSLTWNNAPSQGETPLQSASLPISPSMEKNDSSGKVSTSPENKNYGKSGAILPHPLPPLPAENHKKESIKEGKKATASFASSASSASSAFSTPSASTASPVSRSESKFIFKGSLPPPLKRKNLQTKSPSTPGGEEKKIRDRDIQLSFPPGKEKNTAGRNDKNHFPETGMEIKKVNFPAEKKENIFRPKSGISSGNREKEKGMETDPPERDRQIPPVNGSNKREKKIISKQMPTISFGDNKRKKNDDCFFPSQPSFKGEKSISIASEKETGKEKTFTFSGHRKNKESSRKDLFSKKTSSPPHPISLEDGKKYSAIIPQKEETFAGKRKKDIPADRQEIKKAMPFSSSFAVQVERNEKKGVFARWNESLIPRHKEEEEGKWDRFSIQKMIREILKKELPESIL